jgi:hypothetical protein
MRSCDFSFCLEACRDIHRGIEASSGCQKLGPVRRHCLPHYDRMALNLTRCTAHPLTTSQHPSTGVTMDRSFDVARRGVFTGVMNLTEIPCTGHHCLRGLTSFATSQPDLMRLAETNLLCFHRVSLTSGC